MTDSQLSADHTRPHARRGHLHDLESDVIGKRSAIDEDSSQLIHFSVGVHVRLWGIGFEGSFKNMDIFQQRVS